MKKYRIKKKNVCILAGIILVIVYLIVNPLEMIAKDKLKKLNYSDNAIKYIIKKGVKNSTLSHEYSEFVDKTIDQKDFNIEYYDKYLDLKFFEKSNDIVLVNKLIETGYSVDDINLVLKSGNNNTIKTFLEGTKYDKLSDFLKYDYAKLSLLDRYIEYKASNVCTYKDAVVMVNIGLDNEFYEKYNDVNTFSLTMIVNKYNKVSESFVPNDLIDVPSNLLISSKNKEKANKTLIEAFEKMATDLNHETTKKIYLSNAYRSYEEQEKTYNSLLKQKGESYVNNSVSRPGFSEHQTGLLINIDTVGEFNTSVEKEWLKNNAYKYGFILRYPEKKEEITGYKGITKQYRYVGEEIATYIAKNNITFEEYYAMFLDKE